MLRCTAMAGWGPCMRRFQTARHQPLVLGAAPYTCMSKAADFCFCFCVILAVELLLFRCSSYSNGEQGNVMQALVQLGMLSH